MPIIVVENPLEALCKKPRLGCVVSMNEKGVERFCFLPKEFLLLL